MNFFNWWKARKLRRAQEAHAYWKAQRDAMEKLGNVYCSWHAAKYLTTCGETARHEERVERLMRS